MSEWNMWFLVLSQMREGENNLYVLKKFDRDSVRLAVAGTNLLWEKSTAGWLVTDSWC